MLEELAAAQASKLKEFGKKKKGKKQPVVEGKNNTINLNHIQNKFTTIKSFCNVWWMFHGTANGIILSQFI